ncbi:hypothetical protein MNBD_GAMMA14-2666 [hydrothermal vent metagenome]|uniref:glucose-1-phosphate thymidylyltransferase n=1 Tax=hydrothermal vent metagenome TaxID=652676 RepID=A0A3B0ZDY5_9ZZZZ
MNNHLKMPQTQNIIGIVPMAGTASRLGKIPCSKEIYPVQAAAGTYDTNDPPQVVCDYLLGKMSTAGISRVFVIIRKGKWDIPACLGDGSRHGLELAYLMMGLPYGTPYSVDQAYPFLENAIVALGFPDMVFAPGDLFGQLLAHRATTDADVVLGLFPANRPDKVDMVETNEEGEVKRIVVKPAHTDLQLTWGVAVWSSTFSHFMHEFLQSHRAIAAETPELFVGDIIQAAIEHGLNIQAIQVSRHPFLDIGTSDDLHRIICPPNSN